ncbi:EF-hand domain-containing protein [Pseudoscourfieldia marina]
MVGGTAAPLGSVREMLHGIKLDECPALLRTMLAKFDKNGNGIIDPDELPIANDDGISIKAFPEDVQPILRGIDEEGNGKLEMGELTEMAITYAELKKANKEGSIAIKTLPKELQPTLKVFDVDGDGTVAPMELARGAELYKGSKKTAKRLMTFSGVLLLILCALVGVIVGLVAMVVENSKETKTDSKTGITFAKGSSKPSATGKVRNTQTLFDAVRMSSSQLRDTDSLTLEKPDGSKLIYTITGAETQGVASDGTASAVLFYTARGDVVKVTARKIVVTKADGTVLMTEERASGGGRHLQSTTGGSTMSSSPSADSGGYVDSNNDAWKFGPAALGNFSCIKNPKKDGTHGGLVKNCLCHESCGTCGYWPEYLQSSEDCLSCFDDETYEFKMLHEEWGKTGSCTKKETTTASSGGGTCKALDGVNFKNLVTQGSCKSSWSSTYCTAGTEYAGCPSACDGDSNGNWCMVDDSNWCYCNPTESTPALAPAPEPPKHVCIHHPGSFDSKFVTSGNCKDTWSWNGIQSEGCKNPDNDANGPWCNMDGGTWCYCRDISDGTSVSTFDELKEALHNKATGAKKIYIRSNIQWPDAAGTLAIVLKRSVQIIGACDSSYSLPLKQKFLPASGKPEDGIKVAAGSCLLSAHSKSANSQQRHSRHFTAEYYKNEIMELWFEALTLTNGGGKPKTPASDDHDSSEDGGGSMKLGGMKSLTLKSMIFLDNYGGSGGYGGGALSIGGWSGGSIRTVAISDSHFLNNKVNGGKYGGAILLGELHDVSLTSVMFVGNWAAKGGGIYVGSVPTHGESLTTPTFTCDKCEFQKNEVSGSYTQCGERAGPNVFFSRNAPITNNAAAYFKGCTFEWRLSHSRIEASCMFYHMGIMEYGFKNIHGYWRCGGSGIRLDPATTRIYSDGNGDLAIKSEPYEYNISAIREQFMTTDNYKYRSPFEAFFAEDVCKLSKEWGYRSGINNVCRCRSDLYPNEDIVCSDEERAKCNVAYSSF